MLIAITGSNGFVGNHLSRHLLKLGYQVRLIQRKEQPNVFKIDDFLNFKNWESALYGVDVLIHCAAKVHDSKKSSKKNYESYININVKMTQILGIQAVKAKVKRIIFLSSLKVNGEKTEKGKPFNNYSLPLPVDNYSLSKFKAEEVLQLLSKKENIEVVIVRPPLIYGPNVKSNFLSLIKLLNYGIPLPFLDIRNKRSIIYIENLVSFLSICITKKSAANNTFLVSDLFPISTANLMILISKQLRNNSRLFKFPIFLLKFFSYLINSGDKIDKLVSNLEIDPSFSYEKLKWLPPFSTEEGINKTVEWFKDLKRKKLI